MEWNPVFNTDATQSITVCLFCLSECPDSPVKDCLAVHNLGFRENKLYRLENDEGIYEVSAQRRMEHTQANTDT